MYKNCMTRCWLAGKGAAKSKSTILYTYVQCVITCNINILLDPGLKGMTAEGSWGGDRVYAMLE